MPYIIPQPVREKTTAYVVHKDLFTPDECKKLIEFGKSLPPQVAQVGAGTEGTVDEKKRISELFWLNWSQELDWLFARIAANVASANSAWWGFHLAGLSEALQLTHYKGSKKGHYDWHEDHGETGMFLHRKISGVVLLNDKFKGGDFEFQRIGKPPEMSVGTMILFPSYKLHRVTPVTKGDRWSLVFWVNGPPFV